MRRDEKGKPFPTVTETDILGFFEETRFLSNFHMCPVTVEGITYPSSEHAYMAMKTLNTEERLKIAAIQKASDAKKYGYTIKLRPNWDNISVAMMYHVNYAKYSQNPELRKKLLETGDKRLVEVNDWNDKRWGMCMTADQRFGDYLEGQNLLGITLMAVRDAMKNV